MTDVQKPGEAALFYLDDLYVGQRFTSGSHVLDEAQVKRFASEFDPQPFHLDNDAAKATLFGGLAASGWHTAAVTMRLLVQGGLPIAGGIISSGGELSWLRPTRPGDTLSVESQVVEIIRSRSQPNRGSVRVRSETRNQHGGLFRHSRHGWSCRDAAHPNRFLLIVEPTLRKSGRAFVSRQSSKKCQSDGKTRAHRVFQQGLSLRACRSRLGLGERSDRRTRSLPAGRNPIVS